MCTVGDLHASTPTKASVQMQKSVSPHVPYRPPTASPCSHLGKE